MSATLSIKTIKEQITAAKAKHVAAIEGAAKGAPEALAKLVERFIAGGGKPVTTVDPVLLGSPVGAVELYDSALLQLSLLGGETVNADDLNFDPVELIENAGKIVQFKSKATLSI